jgi:hypothetical protein
LAKRDCPLQKLVLNTADVDDFECEKFVSNIETNTTLTFLSLRDNKIGKTEPVVYVRMCVRVCVCECADMCVCVFI